MIHCEHYVFTTFKQKLEKSERVSFANIRKKNIPGREIIANGNIQDANLPAVYEKTVQNKTWRVKKQQKKKKKNMEGSVTGADRGREMRLEKKQIKSCGFVSHYMDCGLLL